LRQCLASSHKESAIQRSGCAADRHHQRFTDGLKRLINRLRADRIELAQHRFKTPLHIDAVVAVTDRLIEGG
jgi:hypothetical protein